jgi:hypothetical protein
MTCRYIMNVDELILVRLFSCTIIKFVCSRLKSGQILICLPLIYSYVLIFLGDVNSSTFVVKNTTILGFLADKVLT